MNDTIACFMVALGFDEASAARVVGKTKSNMAALVKAVKDAEKEMDDARWAAAKSDEERANLQRQQNLKEAREALAAAKAKEDAEKEQARKRTERNKEFIAGLEKMALAAAAAATAIGYAVSKAAGAFDNLHFVAARTGASVQGLKSLQYAYSQLGSTSAAATSAVENFAKAMRSNDGVKSFVQSLGVDTTKDAVDQYLDTIRALNKSGDYGVGFREAGIAGISEEDYKLVTQYIAKLDEFRSEYNATTKALGVDSEQAAQASASFQRTLTRLQAAVSALGDRLLTTLAPALEGIAKGFQDWIASNPDKIDKIMRGISDAVVWLADKLRGVVEWFAGDGGQKFMERWDEFSERIKAIGHGFEVVWGIFQKIDSWLETSTIWKFLKGWTGLIASGRFGLGGMIQDALGIGGGGSGGGGGVSEGGSGGAGGGASTGSGASGSGNRIGQATQNANSAAVRDELEKAGYRPNAVAAIMGSMETESRFNPTIINSSGHTGLWQWDATKRWPKIRDWIKSKGGDPNDARWQTKAWIAEHNAKPGDALYDGPETARGGDILRGDPSIDRAMEGVAASERYGAREEGGRAANARAWLRKMQGVEGTPGDPSKLRLSGAQATAGGDANAGTVAAAAWAEKNLPGFRAITALNDEFHHARAPNSKHTKGLAADIGFAAAATAQQYRDNAEKFRDHLRSAGLENGKDFHVFDEKNFQTQNTTGPHIHVQFNNPESAARYAEYAAKQRGAQPARSPVPAVPRTSAPRMDPGGFDVNAIDPRGAMRPAAPMGVGNISHTSSNDNSRAVTQNITNNTTVHEARDARETGRVLESSLESVHGLALANAQSAIA